MYDASGVIIVYRAH